MLKILVVIGVLAFVPSVAFSATTVLSERDVALYKEVFALQEKGNIKSAKEKENLIQNPVVMGYVYYKRFFTPQYKTKKKEITDWLTEYPDYPVAPEVYALGKQKKVKNLFRPKGLFGGNTH